VDVPEDVPAVEAMLRESK